MTDFACLLRADRGEPANAIHLVDKASFAEWRARQPAPRRALLDALRFEGKTASHFAILPGEGEAFDIVAAVETVETLSPWCLARLGEALPAGTYRLAGRSPGAAALGWLLAQHRFDRYRTKADAAAGPRILLTEEPAAIDRLVHEAEATALVRDLVDTPASDLGPAELEAAVRSLGDDSGARVEVTHGDALDSGGLDIKPASGMRLMKKDMGGAAHALALARLIIAERLPVRLHLLIPAVENSVSATAFRPGDVIRSRLGLTVEIDNTDAEGRLVLGDALTRAGEEEPGLIIDFATLTGAARVALGPDLPALFVNDEVLAAQLLAAADSNADPLWRMPLWDGYDDMLKSGLADLANAADSPMAGSVTAALFLRRFVPEGAAWAHLDTFAWRPVAKPGRPKGGEALGLRAVFGALEARFGR
jgi:leucyl aminopeptidase